MAQTLKTVLRHLATFVSPGLLLLLLAVQVVFGLRGFDQPQQGLLIVLQAPGLLLGWGSVAVLLPLLIWMVLDWWGYGLSGLVLKGLGSAVLGFSVSGLVGISGGAAAGGLVGAALGQTLSSVLGNWLAVLLLLLMAVPAAVLAAAVAMVAGPKDAQGNSRARTAHGGAGASGGTTTGGNAGSASERQARHAAHVSARSAALRAAQEQKDAAGKSRLAGVLGSRRHPMLGDAPLGEKEASPWYPQRKFDAHGNELPMVFGKDRDVGGIRFAGEPDLPAPSAPPPDEPELAEASGEDEAGVHSDPNPLPTIAELFARNGRDADRQHVQDDDGATHANSEGRVVRSESPAHNMPPPHAAAAHGAPVRAAAQPPAARAPSSYATPAAPEGASPARGVSPIVSSPIVSSPIVSSPIVSSPIVSSPIVSSPTRGNGGNGRTRNNPMLGPAYIPAALRDPRGDERDPSLPPDVRWKDQDPAAPPAPELAPPARSSDSAGVREQAEELRAPPERPRPPARGAMRVPTRVSTEVPTPTPSRMAPRPPPRRTSEPPSRPTEAPPELHQAPQAQRPREEEPRSRARDDAPAVDPRVQDALRGPARAAPTQLPPPSMREPLRQALEAAQRPDSGGRYLQKLEACGIFSEETPATGEDGRASRARRPARASSDAAQAPAVLAVPEPSAADPEQQARLEALRSAVTQAGSDELLVRGMQVTFERGAASAVLLSRRLGVGFPAARDVVSRLVELGLLGRAGPTGAHSPLLSTQEWADLNAE